MKTIMLVLAIGVVLLTVGCKCDSTPASKPESARVEEDQGEDGDDGEEARAQEEDEENE